jgi:hypothetical protein
MATNRRPTPTWEDITKGVEESVDRWSDALDTILNKDEESDTSFEISSPRMETTSSTNPTKPRTLKAGYDYSTGTLTVVFRDGTWWEYRGVSKELWQEFRSAESKGRFMRASGLDQWGDMGPADVGAMPRHRRVQMNEMQEFANYMYSNNKE